MDAPVITVTAKRDGFRRGGRAWSTTPETLCLDELTEEQLDTLVADPNLVVVVSTETPAGETVAVAMEPRGDGPLPTVVEGSSITVVAKRDGFRRGGRAWSTTPETLCLDELTEEQLEALRADPGLILVEHNTQTPGEEGDDKPPQEDPAAGSGEAAGPLATAEGVDPSTRPERDGGEPPAAAATPATSHDVIVKAIGRLDRHDKASWGRDGKPKVAAIEKIAGIDVTAAERDSAWAAVQRGDVRDG